MLEGIFVRLETLTNEHLSDLEKDFDPTLFDFYPKPYETALEFVNENLEMAKQQDDFLPFAIIHKELNEAIGCTEFSGIDRKNRKLEIGGTWLRRHFHGTAANSESKLLLLQYAFETLDFVRVQFTANVLNSRSRSGIERVGGFFEGILRNSMILPNGHFRDDALYSIIESEWPEIKNSLRARIQHKISQKSRYSINTQLALKD